MSSAPGPNPTAADCYLHVWAWVRFETDAEVAALSITPTEVATVNGRREGEPSWYSVRYLLAAADPAKPVMLGPIPRLAEVVGAIRAVRPDALRFLQVPVHYRDEPDLRFTPECVRELAQLRIGLDIDCYWDGQPEHHADYVGTFAVSAATVSGHLADRAAIDSTAWRARADLATNVGRGALEKGAVDVIVGPGDRVTVARFDGNDSHDGLGAAIRSWNRLFPDGDEPVRVEATQFVMGGHGGPVTAGKLNDLRALGRMNASLRVLLRPGALHGIVLDAITHPGVSD